MGKSSQGNVSNIGENLKKYLLGVKIDDVNVGQAVQIVETWLEKSEKHYIVTPNPEFLVDAQNDPEFKKILNEADLSIPDGIGLRINTDIVCNTPGIDLMEELIKMAAEKAVTVGFLGGRDEVAEKAAERLQKKYPKLKVTLATSGGVIQNEVRDLSRMRVSNKLRDSSASPQNDIKIPPTDLLFVAFGHPKQEKWIVENLDKIPVRVAMGVGGSFDYISGRVPRAPLLIRKLMLEWLFRLVIQPWRIKRQLKLLKYLWLVMIH